MIIGAHNYHSERDTLFASYLHTSSLDLFMRKTFGHSLNRIVIVSHAQGNQFDGAAMHRKGDRPGICGQDHRLGGGQHQRYNHQPYAGCDPPRDRYASACNGASLYQ